LALTFRDYSADHVSAAKSVLLELVRLLGEYRDDIVVFGGWVPELTLPSYPNRHEGTIDADLALNHVRLQEPFIFFRTISIEGKPIRVEADFLAGEYGGTEKAFALRGSKTRERGRPAVVISHFEMHTEVRVEGNFPEGGRDSANILVASIVPFL